MLIGEISYIIALIKIYLKIKIEIYGNEYVREY